MRLHDEDPKRQMTIHEATVRALTRVLPQVADVRTHEGLALEVSHARALVAELDGHKSRAGLLGWVARHDVERGEYALAETESRFNFRNTRLSSASETNGRCSRPATSRGR
jgi:hypothetical protein